MSDILEWIDLGIVQYRDAVELQDRLRARRIAGEIGDRLLLLEHPPVFTLGRQDCAGDFLSSVDAIESEGIEVVKTDRGGRITYHGPGQLVVYFICGLSSLGVGVKSFVQAIEEICVRVAREYGIDAGRDEEHPGVWVGNDKLAAIGLNVSRGVTRHGFALNVDVDLSPYRHVVACGVHGRGVTSLARLGRRTPCMEEVKELVVAHAGRVLSCPMRKLDRRER